MGTTREASNWKYSVPQPSESCEPPPVPDVAKTPLVSVRHIPRAFAPNSPVIFLIASPCWTPRAALFPPCPRKKSPRRSGVWPPTSANSSGKARCRWSFVRRKAEISSAVCLKKRGGRRGQPAAVEREDVPMVREFCSKEEVFRGGLHAVPDGGWGRRGNLFYSFSYILTACRRIFFTWCPVFRTPLFLQYSNARAKV